MANITSAFARGVDQTQASLYAFAQAIGNLTGVDMLARFGREGVERNLAELEQNPATVESWDDIETLSDFGDFLLEGVVSQLPGLGVDLAAVMTGGGVGAVLAKKAAMKGAVSKAEKAALGKSIKNQLGEEAFDKFLKNRKKAIIAGQTTAAAASSVAQNTGETQMQFDAAGIGDQTGDVMLAGAFKGALDTLPILDVIKIARKTGVSPTKLPDLLKDAAKTAGVIGLKESLTEGAQTFVDQVAIHANIPGTDLFSPQNLNEIKSAMLIGGVAGGAIGGGASLISNYQSQKEEIEKELEDTVNSKLKEYIDTIPEKQNTLFPEDAGTVKAQIDAVADPTSAKDTAYFSPDTEVPDTLPEGMFRLDTPAGTYVTNNKDKATTIASTPSDELEGLNGSLLYDRPEQKDFTDGSAIVAMDKNGMPVSEVATHPDTFERDYATLNTHVPAGGSLRIDTVDNVVDERIKRYLNSAFTPTQRAQFYDAIRKESPQRDTLLKALHAKARLFELESNAMDAVQQDVGGSMQPKQTLQTRMAEEVPADKFVTPPEINKQGEGFATEEAAARAIAERTQDPNTQYAVTPKDGQFFVEQVDLPAEFAPEPYVTESRTPYEGDKPEFPIELNVAYSSGIAAQRALQGVKSKLPGGYEYNVVQNGDDGTYSIQASRTPRSVTRVIRDAIAKARETGSLRNRLTKNKDPKVKELAESSIVRALDPQGSPLVFTTSDLTSAGMDILAAEQQARDIPQTEYRQLAFSTMVARLQELGYNMNDAFDPASKGTRFRPGLAVMMQGRITSGKPDATYADTKSDFYKEESFTSVPHKEYAVGGKNEDVYLSEERADGIMADVGVYLGQLPKQIKSLMTRKPKGYEEVVLRLRKEQQKRIKAARPVIEAVAPYSAGGKTIQKTQFEMSSAAADIPLFNVDTGDTKITVDKKSLADIERTAEEDNITSEPDTRGLASEQDVDASGASLRALENERIADERSAAAKKNQPDIAHPHSSNIRGFGDIAKREIYFVHGILREIGLHGNLNITLVDLNALDKAAATGILKAYADKNNKTPMDIKNEIKVAFDDPTLKGLFIPSGRDGIIVVRPFKDKKPSDAQKANRLLTMGHEVGHAVLLAIKDQLFSPTATDKEKAWAKRLVEAHKTSGTKSSFDEWYGDQVAARGASLSEEPKGVVDRIFFEAAQTLKRLWDAIKSALPERFKVNDDFATVIQEMKKDKYFQDKKNMGFGAFEKMVDPDTSTMPKELLRKFKVLRASKLFDPAGWPLVRHLFASAGQLDALAPEIADLIEKTPNLAKGKESYYPMYKQALARWNGKFVSVFRPFAKGRTDADPTWQQELKEAYEQLALQDASYKLSPLAQAMRDYITDFHTYLKEAIPTIGFLEAYFPHIYNETAIKANPDGFRKILADHGIETAGILDKVLTEPMDPLQVPDANDMYNTLHTFTGRFFTHGKERKFKDRALIRDLYQGGYLNTNPIEALNKYTVRSIKRAEFERAFGGYAFPLGYKTRQTIAKADDAAQGKMRAANQSLLNNFFKSIPGMPADGMTFQEKFKLAKEWGYIIQDEQKDVMVRDPSLSLKQAMDVFKKKKTREFMANKPDFTEADEKRFQRKLERDSNAVHSLIQHALGLHHIDRTSTQYKVINEIRAYEGLRVTLFSGIASLPEPAVGFLKARGVLSIAEFGKLVMDAVKDPKDAQNFATLMGLLHNELTSAVSTEMFDSDPRGPVSKLLPYMFKYNGNEAVVKWTRMLSSVVAREYLLKLAADPDTKRHKRYLDELNITAKQIHLWDKSGRPFWFTVDKGKDPELYEATVAVQNAITAFVSESSLQPTKADAPPYANNLYGSLIASMKSFAYTFSRGPMKGLWNELEQRLDEGDYAMAQWLIPVALVMLLLGAVSDELRNRLKTLGERGTWEGNSGDTAKMLSTWVDRTGVNAMPFKEVLAAPYSADAWVFDAGPTVSHAAMLFSDPAGDNDATKKFLKSLPVFSQVPGLRKAVYNTGETE